VLGSGTTEQAPEPARPAAAVRSPGLSPEARSRLTGRELPDVLATDPAEGLRVLVVDLLGTDPTVYASIRGPPGSPYEDGTFTVKLCYPQDYPFKPPKLRFTHPVFHPNISADGQVIDWLLLKDAWSPALTTVKLLLDLRTYLADTRCTIHGGPMLEDTPMPEDTRGLTAAVGGGMKVYVVGHEAASAWLTDPQMAEQQAREHTALHARGQ
jgi:ubiquitin-protein ligase